jgi:hypothetical protein
MSLARLCHVVVIYAQKNEALSAPQAKLKVYIWEHREGFYDVAGVGSPLIDIGDGGTLSH